jgi:hypothetical protein
MTTHVCLSARDEIYDGYGIRKDIHQWLRNHVGRAAHDQTDFIWSRAGYRLMITNSRANPQYITPSMVTVREPNDPIFLHFFFKSTAIATLFKLTWGGQ